MSDISAAVRAERDELVRTWRAIFAKTPDPAAATFLQLERIAARTDGKKAVSDDLRKVHDRFGWMAKESTFAGKCAGALYRTHAFIQLPAAQRIGKKKGQTIHIEHTIPVNVLATRWLVAEAASDADKAATLAWVLRNTVATAFHKDEQKTLRKVSSSSDCYVEGTTGFGRPFARYAQLHEGGGRVWDVMNEVEVEASVFTLDHHFDNVITLAEEAGASTDFVSHLKRYRAASV